jgi:hypothetical protein
LKRPLGIPKHGWDNAIKMIIKERGHDDINFIHEESVADS